MSLAARSLDTAPNSPPGPPRTNSRIRVIRDDRTNQGDVLGCPFHRKVGGLQCTAPLRTEPTRPMQPGGRANRQHVQQREEGRIGDILGG